MLGSNPGSNQNAFSSVPAEPLSPMMSAVSLSPRASVTAQTHTQTVYLALRPWAELGE